MTAAADSPAAEFVARFQAFWRAPVVDDLDALLAPEVRLVTPLTATTEGLAEGKRTFARLFAAIPDLTGEVHRWAATGDGVLIEFTLAGSAGGAPIAWDAVDRFLLGADGLATARTSYFDGAAVALAVARRPRAWPAFARATLGRANGGDRT